MESLVANGSQEITVVTGRRACRECDHVNSSGNEYCHHCGAPMGHVPEIVHDPTAAARTRASWKVHGVDTEMVGRQAELDRLLTVFRRVVELGQLRAVLLIGEEGVGKSRLIDEFSQLVNTAFGNALLISSAWRDGSERAYAIIDRVMRSRFYIPESLPQEDARDRLLEGVKAIMKGPVATEIAHRVGQLVDLPFPDSPFVEDSPEKTLKAAWSALANVVRTDALANPLVLVLEDVQFSTPESRALIPFLSRELAESPIMCVLSATPEFLEAHPETLPEAPLLERIELRELADDEIRSLVDQVLHGVPSIPPLLYERVCINSMGNPLIAEEILRILIAEGAIETAGTEWRVHTNRIEDMSLPIGLTDVVQLGLQRLTADERELLEGAAVAGETFWSGALRLLDHGQAKPPASERLWSKDEGGADKILTLLESACAKDVIRTNVESRYPDEVEYSFKHGASRRLLLDSLDAERCSRLHSFMAVWHELNQSMGIRETHEVIALHHERAGQSLRASQAYLRAADEARDAHLNERAVKYYQRALDLLDDTHLIVRLETLHEIGSLYDLMGEYEIAIPYLQDMLRCSWRLASPSKGGAAHNKLGRVYRNLGQFDNAMEHFDLAVHLFRRANDRAGIASTQDDIGKVHWIKGAYRAALEHYTDGLQLRRELGDMRSLALSLNNMGSLMLFQGNFKEALTHFRESLSIRKQIGDRRGEAYSLNNLGVILAERGDLEEALALWADATEVAKQIGDRAMEGMLYSNMGEIACLLGRLDAADGYLSAAAEICEEVAQRQLLFEVTRNQGMLALQRQDSRTALEQVGAALKLSEDLESKIMTGIALRSLAEVHAYQMVGAESAEHISEAERAFRASIEILQQVGHDAELGRAYLSYGLFLLEQGLTVQAKKRLTSARSIFERLGMKRLLEKSDSYLGQIS